MKIMKIVGARVPRPHGLGNPTPTERVGLPNPYGIIFSNFMRARLFRFVELPKRFYRSPVSRFQL